VGWRRTEALECTLHEIAESTARLVVAGPLWARSRAGHARPKQHQLSPIAVALAHPHFARAPFPLFSAQLRLLARFLSSHRNTGRGSRANSRSSSHSCAF
jgi:hypothetical protein